MSSRTALLVLILAGCGTNTHPPDGDSGMDAAISDGGGTDAEPDAGSDVDTGIDCSTIGCGAPTFCGELCTAPCGCCDCGGESYCEGNDLVECAGGCYRRTSCGDDRCLTDLVRGSCVTVTCAQLEGLYDGAISATRCGDASECQVLTGHCGIGLGGCYHAVSSTITQAFLDELAGRWRALGCDAGRPVCDCPRPPPSVRCDAGGCLAG